MKKYQSRISFFLLFITLFSACSSERSDQESNEQSEEITIYELKFAEPEEVGLSSDSLKKIDGMISRYVENMKYPGAVVLIAKEGKIVYETEVGWSDSLQTEPYRKDHIFRMASMTKPFVSVAAMKLIEEGKLSLDDPVSKFIPEFANAEVITSFNSADTTWESEPARRAPTVRHLLTHTAGVPYGFMNPAVNGALLAKYDIPDLASHMYMTIGEKMADIGKLPLMHHPGEKFMYGLNTDVLGRVVEVASNMSLSAYLQANILDTLDLDDTKFFFDSTYADRIVEVYGSNSEGKITYLKAQGSLHPDYPFYGAKTYFSGGSGLSGTARDYFKFSQMMLNDGELGGIQILKPETSQMMHQNQIDTISFGWGPAKFGFGFDVALEEHPTRPEGTYSWSGAFATTFWIDPENDMIAIMLSQVLFPQDRGLTQEFEKIVYSSVMETEME